MSRSNIELRAARYFGMEGDPRTSVKVSRHVVALVCQRGNATVVGVYSEELGRANASGHYLYLDGDKADQLSQALWRHSPRKDACPA